MSRKYLGVLILALAVTTAGCTCFSGSAPSEGHTGEKIAPTVSFSPTTAPSTVQNPGQAPETKPFDMSKAGWVEYKVTGHSNGQPYAYNVKLEYGSSSAGGVQTQSIRRTITSDDTSSMSVLNDGKLFNSHVSNTQSSTASGPLAPFDRIRSDDPVLCADRIAGGTEGSESVTVPKGTYECKKYAGSFKGSDSTYWGAPGVPVPIKVYTACDGTTLELVDWG